MSGWIGDFGEITGSIAIFYVVWVVQNRGGDSAATPLPSLYITDEATYLLQEQNPNSIECEAAEECPLCKPNATNPHTTKAKEFINEAAEDDGHTKSATEELNIKYKLFLRARW